MKVLACVACESGAGPQLAFAAIVRSIEPDAALTLLHVLPRGGDAAAAEECLSDAQAKIAPVP